MACFLSILDSIGVDAATLRAGSATLARTRRRLIALREAASSESSPEAGARPMCTQTPMVPRTPTNGIASGVRSDSRPARCRGESSTLGLEKPSRPPSTIERMAKESQGRVGIRAYKLVKKPPLQVKRGGGVEPNSSLSNHAVTSELASSAQSTAARHPTAILSSSRALGCSRACFVESQTRKQMHKPFDTPFRWIAGASKRARTWLQLRNCACG